MGFKPAAEVLEKYAHVLVNFALGSGQGLQADETVYLQSPVSALPLYNAVKKAIINTGGHIINGLYDDTSGLSSYFFQHASHKQLSRFHTKFNRGLVADTDHRIAILSKYDVHELDNIDPRKLLLAQRSAKPLMRWFDQKENAGLYTWTLALYGTAAMAQEAGLSPKAYWDQIIKACYLDYPKPVLKWRQISRQIKQISNRLTKLAIRQLHIQGPDADLLISLGEDRRWLGGGGRNIPSFEIFTSPDWRRTEGWIRFNQPLYYYGPMIKGIELHFKAGRVVKSSASQNYKLLKEMLATDEGAAQLGEFSLTDRRLSRITKFMAETLFDENIGGRHGNTHIALGKSYHDAYTGNIKRFTPAAAKRLGFNDSVIHTDMISTAPRTVTAVLANGRKKVIYQNGQFTL